MGTVVHGWPRSQRETFETGDIERPDGGGQVSESLWFGLLCSVWRGLDGERAKPGCCVYAARHLWLAGGCDLTKAERTRT